MGMRARWLWRHSEGSREGPMSSNPARPTGESNPVAWPQPEARHRPWGTAASVHRVRGDSARKHSKEMAAAGFERKLAHMFCGGALGSHQRGQFGSIPSLWLQELVSPCRRSGASPVHMSNSALLIGNAGMSVRLACNMWWLLVVMGSRVRLDRAVRHAKTM